MVDSDSIAALQGENARLIALLQSNGIDWRLPSRGAGTNRYHGVEPSRFSTAEKVALFRRLFRGRTDVFPVRREGKSSGKSGYAPACSNEWRPGVCEKPRIKCSECGNRVLNPLTDAVIYAHLAGKQTVGVYPLLTDDTCHFLAADFDEADWQEDIQAYRQSCLELGVPVAIEISRSGKGAHAWVFFAARVLARDARRLGTAIISHTCARTRQLKLESYDRLFPNQDSMPKEPWCWLCRCRGKERCSSTRVGSTGSMPTRPTCESLISSIPATRHCCVSGTSVKWDTGRWAIRLIFPRGRNLSAEI